MKNLKIDTSLAQNDIFYKWNLGKEKIGGKHGY